MSSIGTASYSSNCSFSVSAISECRYSPSKPGGATGGGCKIFFNWLTCSLSSSDELSLKEYFFVYGFLPLLDIFGFCKIMLSFYSGTLKGSVFSADLVLSGRVAPDYCLLNMAAISFSFSNSSAVFTLFWIFLRGRGFSSSFFSNGLTFLAGTLSYLSVITTLQMNRFFIPTLI